MIPRKRLEMLAHEIEDKLEKGGMSLANHVCRLINGKDAKISAFMLAKVVEWGYGKPVQAVRVEDDRPALTLGLNEPTSDQPNRVC